MPENCPANGENAEQKTDNKKKKAKRKCKVCGTTLSEYNKNDRCFCHYELDMDNSEDWQKGGFLIQGAILITPKFKPITNRIKNLIFSAPRNAALDLE